MTTDQFDIIMRNIAALNETIKSNHREITNRLDALPAIIGETILTKLGRMGAISTVDEDTITRIMDKNVSDLEKVLKCLRDFEGMQRAAAVPVPEFLSFEWGNSTHMVPENYQMPQKPALNIWRLWIFGCQSQRIAPLCKLKPTSLSIVSQRTQFSKAKYVMEYILLHLDMTFDQIRDLGVNQAEQLFVDIYADILGWLDGYEGIACSNAYIYIKEIEKDINSSARSQG